MDTVTLPVLTRKEKQVLKFCADRDSYRPCRDTLEALMSLVALGLMEPDDNKPDIYVLTERGQRRADEMEAV